MTGTEWEEKFRAEHGRLPKRDEYQAAMARHFEDLPLETQTPKKVQSQDRQHDGVNVLKKQDQGRQHKPAFGRYKGWLGKVGVAGLALLLVLGLGVSLVNHYQHLKKTGPETSMTVSDDEQAQALSASSAKAGSEKKQADATSAASTQQLKAGDLSRIDQAYILTDVIAQQEHWQAKGITAIGAKVRGDTRILTFSNHDKETVKCVYQLTKEATVATGRYTVDGKNVKPLTVNFADWLKNHQLADIQTHYDSVALD